MLPLCGLELYLVVSNFNVTEGPPPTLPPTLPPSPSTTPSSMIYSRRQDSKDTQGEREFRHYLGYILDSDSYTRLNNDARLYVFLPSAVSAITSLSILMALCCIDIFTTTVSLYTSFALGVLTLTCTLISQSHVNVEDEDFFQMTVWMMASFIALLLLLSLQTVLTIWELRHQSAAWPIINWMNFFTWNTAFLVARMVLGVYVIISLCESPFTRGIYTKCTNDWNDWSCPHVRYPIWLSLPVMGTATYSLLVTFEAFFSYYLGISHRPWRAARTGIEGVLAFIGFLGSVCSSAPDSTKPIVAGVIMMVFTIIQILILANEHSLLKKQSEVPPSDDQQKILNEKSEVEIDQNTSNTDIQRDDVVLVA
ncbi:hypothetical protein Pmani_019489 [Petrolisthes manimaculis]|uniref:Uncharacterized protein n=1 Tax=Petrolisthes manimaculis TaxID=1843537 RepID=A0AAE1PIT2_9EUCA|nr:hypothetical protein Pmani_019489 [Petrolisthes manimaculis]